MQDRLFHYEPNHFQENIVPSHFPPFPGKQNKECSEKELSHFSPSFIFFQSEVRQPAAALEKLHTQMSSKESAPQEN